MPSLRGVQSSSDAKCGGISRCWSWQSVRGRRHTVATCSHGRNVSWPKHGVDSRCVTVRVMGETLQRLTSNSSTGECRDALIDGWMRDRPRPKLVRREPDGAYVSNAMLEPITGLNLDVQVSPLEPPWHLSVLGTVQQLVKRSASLHARHEGRTSTCAERLHIDPERDGWDLTSYVAERHVRQQSAHEAWHEAEAEHRVSRAQNMRSRNHQHWPSGTRVNWSGTIDILSRRMDAHEKPRILSWTCSGSLSRAGTSTRKWRPLRGRVVWIVVMSRLLRLAPEHLTPLSQREDRHMTLQSKQPDGTERFPEVVQTTDFQTGTFPDLRQQQSPFDKHVPPLHSQVFEPPNLAEQWRRYTGKKRHVQCDNPAEVSQTAF